MPKVSVIIAVYNVELYIKKCLHTLFRQTLGDIEYIFVNDGSTDRSLEIIAKVFSSNIRIGKRRSRFYNTNVTKDLLLTYYWYFRCHRRILVNQMII